MHLNDSGHWGIKVSNLRIVRTGYLANIFKFHLVAWVLIRDRRGGHRSYPSQTTVAVHCSGRGMRKEALPDGFRVGL